MFPRLRMVSQNSTVRCAASVQYSHAACHGANGIENGSMRSPREEALSVRFLHNTEGRYLDQRLIASRCARSKVKRAGGDSMSVLALVLTVLVLLPSVAAAQIATEPTTPAQVPVGQPGASDREDDFVRAPDNVRIPRPEFFPRFKEYLSTLPPFFRDTSLKLRSRTFYYNQ